MVYFNNIKTNLILIYACHQHTCIFRIPYYINLTNKRL